jgi:M6 family metalloprotease-like protein
MKLKLTYRLACLLGLFCGLIGGPECWFGAQAVTLTEFGHGIVNPGDSRYLLVILGDFDCFPRHFGKDSNFYWNQFFNRNTFPSMNGFLWENSLGRFQLKPAGPGVIGPLAFNTNESFLYYYGVDQIRADDLYGSNVVRRAMTSGLFDFSPYDANHDNVVEPTELYLTFMNSFGGAASRGYPKVQPPGFNYAVSSGQSAVWDFPNNLFITYNFCGGEFATIAHEQMHQLGTVDLYGRLGQQCPANNLTLMSCTGYGALWNDINNTNLWYEDYIYHLDSWHKMLLGWCEPRLVSINQGGRFVMPAAQLRRNDAAVLLYSPSRGANDFFLLEYRTPNTPLGKGYDADVGGRGLVIWHYDPGTPNLHNPYVYSEGAPSLVAGGGMPFGSDSSTPNLRWRDSVDTHTWIYIHPFMTNAAEITIDIFHESDIWVDFQRPPGPEDGTFPRPYDTAQEGLDNMSYGGTLWFKTGSTLETPQFRKAGAIKAYNGPVTFGR